jgi:hypothetical protein
MCNSQFIKQKQFYIIRHHMRKPFLINRLLVFCAAAITIPSMAHPTGDLISVDESVLWSYVSPVDDPGHHACVMKWQEGAAPEVLFRSAYEASDYMLYNRGKVVYIIERRFVQATDSFQSRLLKMTMGEKPVEIWAWFDDAWRVGEGGFVMESDDRMIFATYPAVYSLEKGGKPEQYSVKLPAPVNGLREVADNQLLLMGEASCWLVDRKGEVVKTWNNLLNEQVDNAPLNRNRIFDFDYRNGDLLMAYWGQRSFETISGSGERTTLASYADPLTPHWVSYHGNGKLLFASELRFDGSNPKPHLVLMKPDGKIVEIWKD